MNEIESRNARLEAVGWDADVSDTPTEYFEALVHEMAHNLVLGDMTPKSSGDTSALIRSKTPGRRGDLDEILVTAVTIQTLESYGVLGATDLSLESVGTNVRDPFLARVADDAAIELINTPKVLELAGEIRRYIEALA